MKYLDKIVKYFLAILMIVITCLTFYQIIMRFVFNNASSWSEEATRFLFIWANFIAAGIGIREHIHIGIDIIVNMMPFGLQKIINVLIYAIISIFGGWLSYSCVGLMQKTGGQFSTALKYPKSWLYAPVLVFGLLCVFCGIYEIIIVCKNKEEQ